MTIVSGGGGGGGLLYVAAAGPAARNTAVARPIAKPPAKYLAIVVFIVPTVF